MVRIYGYVYSLNFAHKKNPTETNKLKGTTLNKNVTSLLHFFQ